MIITPLVYYTQALASGEIRPDAQQKMVVEKLDVIFQALESRVDPKWFMPKRKNNPIKGLYLWGNVGIGKTFLMDCFYHCLTVPKLRLHFHQFLQRMHEELKQITGTKNPLAVIAKKISEEARVIFFDEFFIFNIADAMILGELFSHLFYYNVTLVASANVPPDLLYKEGLQRERFLPAIALIQQHTEVLHLHSFMDYRRQHIHQVGVFYTPLNHDAARHMENAFIHFSNAAAINCNPIIVYDRVISVIKHGSSVIWFDFNAICGRPRSQNDYLEIAKQYHTVMVQDLRQIESNENDLIVSFIYLVDILYDAHCRLIISSAVAMDKIYVADRTVQPFQRTLSRLIEMQSEAYIYPEMDRKEMTSL